MKALNLVVAILLFFFVITPVSAQEMASPEPTPEATSSASFDSFVAFWPLSAGRTMDDSFYGLKTFKENMRGMMIFGKNEKAEYDLQLSVKRLLEAEKLANDNKVDSANKTLVEANKKLESAGTVFGNTDTVETLSPSTKENVTEKVANMKLYLDSSPFTKSEIKDELAKAKELIGKIASALEE